MSEIKTKADEHQVTGVMLGIVTTEGADVYTILPYSEASDGVTETKCKMGKEFCLKYKDELMLDDQEALDEAAGVEDWEDVFDIYFENHHTETCDIVHVPFGMFSDEIVAALAAFKTKPVCTSTE